MACIMKIVSKIAVLYFAAKPYVPRNRRIAHCLKKVENICVHMKRNFFHS